MRCARAILATCAMATVVSVLPATAPGQEPTEHGTKRAQGLEVTLLSAAPLSPADMQRMMSGMGGTGGMGGMAGQSGMQGMGGMMRGMPGMGGMGAGEAQPTHWIGVIVRDMRGGRVVPDLDVSLAVRKGAVTRTVKLMPMPGSYGANIGLPEKGRYSVLVAIARPGDPLNVAFDLDYE